MNCSFVRVAEPERGGAIRSAEAGDANVRAVAQANPIRPRYADEGGQPAEDDEACTGGEATSRAPAGPSGVIGDSAQGKISRGTWETRQGGGRSTDPQRPAGIHNRGKRPWPGVGEAHSSEEAG